MFHGSTILARLTVTAVCPFFIFDAVLAPASPGGTVRERVENLVRSVPGTTNLAALEIYDSATNRWDHIRGDVVRLVCYSEGGIGEDEKLLQVFQVPQNNRFYIKLSGIGWNDLGTYFGPFEGDPLVFFGGSQQAPPYTRPANQPIINAVQAEPDNPLGLDDDTIVRLFTTGRKLQSVAHLVSNWAERHQAPGSTSFDEAFAPYLNRDELRQDPFGDKTRVTQSDGRIRVFSVGPDGVWDGGKMIASGDSFLKGDLGAELEPGKFQVRFLAEGALVDYLTGKRTARYLAKKGKRYNSVASLERVDGKLHFGPVVDGLSAAVELIPKAGDFKFGEPVEVRFHIRNEADYEIQIAGDNWREGDKLILKYQDGSIPGNIPISTVRYSGISRIQRQILKPGESAVFRSAGLKFHSIDESSAESATERLNEMVSYHPQKLTAGDYVLRFKLNFPGWNAQLMDWRGELETGEVSVAIH